MFRFSTTGQRELSGVLVAFVGSLLLAPVPTRANDNPPRGGQPAGVHSTVVTSDGQIRDDFLAAHLASEIVANGGQVKDVKIIANCCYGGGLMDDLSAIFGAYGAVPGVPWIMASAADWYEYAWAFRAEWCADPAANLGSKLTSALAGPHSGHWDSTPGAMLDSSTDNVLSDLTTARQHDEAGPFHEQSESVVITYGNGGENLVWNASGTSHEVILFGGRMNQPAYYNDMDNMTSALQGLYGAASYNIQALPDGTLQDLLDAISAACANLDANTQLLIHFTDHGGFTCDVVEHYQAQGQDPPYTVPDILPTVIWLPPPPWPKWPGNPPPPPPPDEDEDPLLKLWLLYPIHGEFWIVQMNDDELPLEPGEHVGELELPVAWESLREGENTLTISVVGDPGELFVFDQMELWSGPVEHRADLPPEGAVYAVMEYDFTAPWLPGSSRPFYMPPQDEWPVWEQSGELEYYYSDPQWPDQAGFWGVCGAEQTATLTGHMTNTYNPAEKQQITVSADIMAYDLAEDAWSVVVRPDSDGVKPPAAHRPVVVETLPNADGSVHCTWELGLTPVPESADVVITMQTGTSVDSFIFIDNLAIELTGEPKDESLESVTAPPEYQDQSRAQYYYFERDDWPPEALYEVLPTWHAGTTWDRFGSYPPEWLPEVADHAGVLGLPGGSVADGELVMHLEGQADAIDRERIACQFDYFNEGGIVLWDAAVPPECVIENLQETIVPLEDGWQRVRLSYDVVPPALWHDMHWVMSTDDLSSQVAIDNFVTSSSTWWADYWHDAFDFYEAGAGLHGQYGWKGWDNDPLADAVVTDEQAHSPFNAMVVAGSTDLVHEVDQAADRWAFTAWQYVPGDFQSGGEPPFEGSYLVMMNTYADGGPHEESHWSLQMNFDSNDGMLKVYYGNGLNTVDVPYVPDEWIEISVVVDLTRDWAEVYYDGQFVVDYAWTGGVLGGGGGALDVAAVDVCANESTAVYYDDMYLRPMVAGDMNWDEVVEFEDVLLFCECLAGPEVTYDPGCMCADLDWDVDVDVADLAVFQQVFGEAEE